jgi:hypothetical protein
VLAVIAQDDSLHGMLRGRCCRLLYEQGAITNEDLATQISLAVTPALESSKVAQWLQGFLQGSGQTLLQFDPLWDILNNWLCTLSDEMFRELVVLLRRAFSDFSNPELRMMGQKIKKLRLDNNLQTQPHQTANNTNAPLTPRLDMQRVEKVLPILKNIMLSAGQ